MKVIIAFLLFIFISANSYAVNYYVDCNASSGGNGSSSTPWDTVSDFNSATFATSDDVYFKVGCDWQEEMKIHHSGTSSDRAIIGSYYGTNTPGVSTFEKPIIRGNMASIADEAVIETSAGIPQSQYEGLINIGADASNGYQAYVTVKNFQVLDSAGRGIVAWHKNSGTEQFNTNNTIQDNYVKHTASAGIAVAGQRQHIYNNVVAQTGLFSKYSSRKSGGQPCIYTKGTATMIESNRIQECWYEGIGSYKNSGYTIIVDNLAVAVRRVGIYMSESSNAIIDRNKIVGDINTGYTVGVGTPINIEWFYPGSYPDMGIRVTSEEFKNQTTNNIYVRNNLITNTGGCIYVSVNSAARALGGTSEGFFYGNTCAGNNAIGPMSSTYSVASMTVKNNVFIYSINEGLSGDCKAGSLTTWDYNYMPTPFVDTDCNGSNDVVGGLSLNRTVWGSTIGMSNIPSDDDFRLASSTVDDLGENLNTVVHNISDYPICNQLQGGCASLDLITLGVDYTQIARDSTPDIGAFNHAPAPTLETAPYYQNIGGSAFVGTVSYQADEYVTSSGTLSTDTTASAISNTTDDIVFQSVRFVSSGDSITISVPIANGTYDVTLGYVNYSSLTNGLTCDGTQGPNVFDVSIEGIQKENEFNVCINTGGINTALDKKYGSIVVADQTMTVILNPGSTGTDNRPFIASIKITAVAINIGSPTKSISINNEYSNATTINAINECIVTGAGAVTITGVTQPTTGTVAISMDTLSIEYTPVSSSTSGLVGSTTVTFNDGSSSDTCVMTITVNATVGKRISFRAYGSNQSGQKTAISSSTGWQYWIIDSVTNVVIPGTEETTDSSGVISIFDNSLVVGRRYRVVLFNQNTVTVGTSKRRSRVYFENNAKGVN